MIDPIDSGLLSETREHDAGDGTPYHQLSAAVLKISSAAMVEDWEVKVRRRSECLADTINESGKREILPISKSEGQSWRPSRACGDRGARKLREFVTCIS
jgi:hypothetical protein